MNITIYVVNYPQKIEFAEVAITDVEYDYGRYISCPQCGRRVSGAYWMQPREIVLTSHKTPDFLYAYCDSSPFLLSEKALTDIRSAGLKGIVQAEEIEHVKFQRKSKKEVSIPKYYHIELARSHITIDHKRSVISYGNKNETAFCPLCNQVSATYDFFRSLSFHMDMYEGYDIFQIYEMGEAVFLSQHFVEFCKDRRLTNLHFTSANKYGQETASYFLDGNEDA